jgi:diguanylate cyclase (GGDEF)-like protein
MSALSPTRMLAIIETQSEIASAGLALDEVMDLVVSRAQAITAAAAAVLELIEGEEMVYHAVSGSAEAFSGVRLAVQTSLSGRCLLQGEVLYCRDAETDARVDLQAARRVGATSMLCVPLVHGERAVGVLKVYDARAHAFDEDDVTTLRLLSSIIAAAMAHAEDFERQHHESHHDALTGLPNRRAFENRLAIEVSRVARYGGELTVCMADLDSFKRINDLQGHAAGDRVLRDVAAVLRRLRDTDQAFRFGGDEFAVIFSGVDAAGAGAAMRRAQEVVSNDPACRGVGLSWGLAQFPGDDPDTLVLRADAALYAAKRHRRQSGALSSV